ncbi:1-aminocyclopropane-1-carboxylate deaminase [Alishewanella longhuensis]|uniref:1-aminocyclopropane-1-carboxylate deaminase n=1 Tax=Alishewanella longhuensis TaxID=1091037 RepID=A0ABQ3L1A2_9ALTE|nr:cysteine desulfhydrase [Alishewanella longhuensis]GHG72984.1 1-aminocyclopropane-1-carboxylate deaminase [Alishewanella longhuensis]
MTVLLLPEISWQQLTHPILTTSNTELWICQLKPPVPQIAGNKWLKLHSAISQRLPTQGILSLGGAFSNHLAALAAAGNHYGFPTIGLVRTDQLDSANPTLQQCSRNGMQLRGIDRVSFRQRDSAEFNHDLVNNYPNYLIVPEGGSNQQGAAGVSALPLAETPAGKATLLCCATASGGTLAGIIQRYPDIKVLGLAVVKDRSLVSRVKQCLPDNRPFVNWQLTQASSAYGKVTAADIAFCCELKPQITLEPVYTGKALHQLLDLLTSGQLASGQRIAFFHTGGLQGLAGQYYRKLISKAEYHLLAADGSEEPGARPAAG